ncbi:MAG TPA: ChbG/HpnK family deacetylase [Thermoanaerobaculia bacterium]|nr:ChbG/HpnK family deacetylase [Thermoanaerobaculia bacterium]
MSETPRLLIVNADDLGRTPGINEGIFAAHREGIVSSATLMVAYPAAREAAAALGDHPGLGVGLHVQLTGGRPTLPPERVPSLVDGEGRLPRSPERVSGFEPAHVLAEIEHQLDLFHRLTGRAPTHLDSHHHSHRLPVVLDGLIEVARRHGLPVRNASPEVARRLAAEEVATTDVFVERFFGDDTGLDTLLAVLDDLAPGSTELMCHPARVDDELAADSTYTAPRERELATLTDPAARDALAAHGVRLVHFGALAAVPAAPGAAR